MLAARYGRALRQVLDHIDRTQMPAIHQAARWIADALAGGGALHLFDTGHMLNHEAVGRAGGLMAINPLRVVVEVNHRMHPRTRSLPERRTFMDEITGLADFVIARSQMYPGDVLLLGSVSGKNPLPVDLALKARAAGIKVVAITSVSYSRTVQPQHSSGKRLYEVADIALDIGGCPGDAALEVEGLPVRFGPTSGIAAAYVNWLLQATVVELLLEQGLVPAVYLSNHMPGAEEHNNMAKRQVGERGY